MPMSVHRCADYEAISVAAAATARPVIEALPNALICLATGASPRGLYDRLTETCRTHPVRGFALDEWHGLPPDHPATCRRYLRERVFDPWNIADNRRFVFDSSASDAAAECERMAEAARREGPFDLCILGLGRNGHLGLNEPADRLQARAHVARLDDLSRRHPMLQGAEPSFGLTMGMGDILSARRIILLVSGHGKNAIAGSLLRDTRVHTQCPASFLHLHPDVQAFIDLATIEISS